MTRASNQSELENWSGYGILYIDNNITLTGSACWPNITMHDGSHIDGQKHIINTINLTNFNGLIKSNGNNISIAIENIGIVANDVTIIGASYGALYSNANNNTGINVTIINCNVSGDYSVNLGGGGICAGNIENGIINISKCYSTCTIHDNAGGIVGNMTCNTTNCTISDCFSIGNITGKYAGGIIGDNSGNLIITNSYSTGNISANVKSAGGISGKINNHTIISNSYSSGIISRNSAGIVGLYVGPSDDLTISNCFSLHAIGTGIGSKEFVVSSPNSCNVTNSGAGNGTWTDTLASIPNYLINTDIWDTTSQPYLLRSFQSEPWNCDTYISFTSQVAFVLGDPRINTFLRILYKLCFSGPFRLLDNNHKNRFVINGLIRYGINDYRCKNMMYIRKICIRTIEKKIIIDTGFRGRPVRVRCNNGFNIENEKLEMSRVKRKCNICDYITYNKKDNSHNYGKHCIPIIIRNRIKIIVEIKDDNIYTIIIMNVSKSNCNPCQIIVHLKNIHNLIRYSGALVREYRKCDIELNNICDL